MITVEIFGGKEDGSTIQVSEQTLMSGRMHRPAPYIPTAFTDTDPSLAPVKPTTHEVWLFAKMFTPSGVKVKLVEENVFRKFMS